MGERGKKKTCQNKLKQSNETVPLKEKMELEVSNKQESSLEKASVTTGIEESKRKVLKKAPNNGKNVKASKGRAGQHRQIKSNQMKISEGREKSEDDHPNVVKSKKIAAYLVSIGRLLCLAFLYRWRF